MKKKLNQQLPVVISLLLVALVISVCQKKSDIGQQNPKNTLGQLDKNGLTNQNSLRIESDCQGTGINHFITYAEGKKMIDKYQTAVRTKKVGSIYDTNGWIYSESFTGDAIRTLLNQPGCCMFRTYFGIGNDNKQHLIFVGTSVAGRDIFSTSGATSSTMAIDTVPPLIVDMGAPCPTNCSGTYVTL